MVTLEVVKIMQGIKITFDKEMISTSPRIVPVVQSSCLNEELGQIEYIFSDKTGTLTKNVMQFKKFSLGDKIFGKATSESLIHRLGQIL